MKRAKRKDSRSDARNARIVASLIGSLTIGAGLLLWLEPRSVNGGSGSTMLMMENVPAVEDVTIEYAAANAPYDAAQFDCVLLPDGRNVWQPTGASIRVLVVGSGSDTMPQAQAAQLLRLLGTLRSERGLDLRRIQLSEESDWRHAPGLPIEARDLAELLLRKDFIR